MLVWCLKNIFLAISSLCVFLVKTFLQNVTGKFTFKLGKNFPLCNVFCGIFVKTNLFLFHLINYLLLLPLFRLFAYFSSWFFMLWHFLCFILGSFLFKFSDCIFVARYVKFLFLYITVVDQYIYYLKFSR